MKTLNECTDYFRLRGLWLEIVIDERGEVMSTPMTPPDKKGCMHSVLSPASDMGSDLLQVLNENVKRLQNLNVDSGELS